jgi:hypothetical protein
MISVILRAPWTDENFFTRASSPRSLAKYWATRRLHALKRRRHVQQLALQRRPRGG